MNQECKEKFYVLVLLNVQESILISRGVYEYRVDQLMHIRIVNLLNVCKLERRRIFNPMFECISVSIKTVGYLFQKHLVNLSSINNLFSHCMRKL